MFSSEQTSGADYVEFTNEAYRSNLLKTLCSVAKYRPVYVTMPYPEFGVDVAVTMARRLRITGHSGDIAVDIDEYRKRNVLILELMREAKAQCGVRLLDPTPYLCPGGKCMGSLNGRPRYNDSHHLSEYGNSFLIQLFTEAFMQRSQSSQ